jgi:1-pyrroline-5-carboxylate dehydrogenase
MNGNDKGFNLVQGKWVGTATYNDLPDPLTGKPLMKVPATTKEEIEPFIDSLKSVPKSGLHNPFKNKERYLMLSEVNRKVVETMHDPEVFQFFVKSIQRCCGKSEKQTIAELKVTVDFFENFCGDRVRFLA